MGDSARRNPYITIDCITVPYGNKGPSDLCQACGIKGGDLRPDFHWEKNNSKNPVQSGGKTPGRGALEVRAVKIGAFSQTRSLALRNSVHFGTLSRPCYPNEKPAIVNRRAAAGLLAFQVPQSSGLPTPPPPRFYRTIRSRRQPVTPHASRAYWFIDCATGVT